MSKKLKKGDYVERFIEGLWFAAQIEKIDLKKKTFTLKYIDDGNIETDVGFSEVRDADINNLPEIETKSEISNCLSPTRTSTGNLLKPLLGLVEDDSEERMMHRPTVIIHKDLDCGEAIIINGDEKKLAVGGGVRARRYLKK